MAAHVCVLASDDSRASDRAFAKFAELFGVSVEIETLAETAAGGMRPISPGCLALAVSQATLRTLERAGRLDATLASAPFIFVHGFAADEEASTLLARITRGAVTGMRSPLPGRKRIHVNRNARLGDLPVTGKSFVLEAGPELVFELAARSPAIEIHLAADRDPVCVSTLRGETVIFLLAVRELVDIDLELAAETSLRRWYIQLVAMALFLRTACGPRCWTAPSIGATIILDDPSLRERYGFVRYSALLSALETTESALTVAFIPYNFRRGDRATIARARNAADRFSIAVHGCDHTNAEFGSRIGPWMECTVSCALERMQIHRTETGLPFDNMIVFPQGRFSTTAIRALRAGGFAAAVNTTLLPVDWSQNRLAIRDLLSIAMVRYDGFPIFIRRRAEDLFEQAFDMLFQKPLLVEVHHDFFRQGMEPLRAYARKVAALTPRPQWAPLGRNLHSSCVIKNGEDGRLTLRHFTPQFTYRNDRGEGVQLSMEKPETERRVSRVLVNGNPTAFDYDSGLLRYSAVASPGESLAVDVQYHEPPRDPCAKPCCPMCQGSMDPASGRFPGRRRNPTWRYRVNVAFRRVLSDFRDNQIARFPALLTLTRGWKRKRPSVSRSK